MKIPANLRVWVEINLRHLDANVRSIRSALPAHLRYIAVIKADAYRHGFAAVAARLMRCGADAFAVANLDEAAALRELGEGWPILILSPLLPGDARRAIQLGVIPVISTVEEARSLAGAAESATANVHWKIDTGMGRTGTWFEDADAILREISNIPNLRVSGCCTHFSAADTDPDFTSRQRDRFLEILQRIPDRTEPFWIHADNSAGISSFPRGGSFNAARIGLLQFGVSPHPHSLLSNVNVSPVLSFHTRVGLIKNLPAGTDISYGRTHTLKRASRIAVLTAGYADGIPTSLSNRGHVLIRGRRCPILGKVTMDQTVVDITGDNETIVGEPVLLVGRCDSEEITATEFSRAAGIIEWEFFCSLSQRVSRFYHVN